MEVHSKSIGKIKILELRGSFDAYTASGARQWFEEKTSSQQANIVVNLEGVTFLDSTALSVLVQGLKRSRQALGDVRLCNLQPPVRIIFELTRLDKVFEIYNSEEDAVHAFLNVEASV
jgi:anti-sigma B factor antagonist